MESIKHIPLGKSNINFKYNEKSWQEEFGILEEYIDNDEEHIMNLSQIKTKLDLDRYSDIRPYIYNQIYINKNKYINASSIDIFNQRYFISTQGPLKETIEDFWTMIDENKVNVIVMLCNENEDGIEKCTNYWNEKNKMKKYQLSKGKKYVGEKYIIRELNLINILTKKGRLIRQIQFTGWPDHGIPDISGGKIFDIFNEMIQLVDQFRNKYPIVVHCSAGVGRTGTFITIYCLNKEIQKQINGKEKEIQFSIFNFVRKLKEMRLFSVQTNLQYYFIYQYVNYFLLNYNI